MRRFVLWLKQFGAICALIAAIAIVVGIVLFA